MVRLLLPAHPEAMDAFEMTRPVLSGTTFFTRRVAPVVLPVDPAAALIEARRYVNQLPLGRSPGPGVGRPATGAEARRDVERALWRTAAAHGVCVTSSEAPADLARRLVRARAIVAPAADAVALLLPALELGAGTDARHLATRLVGYLDERAERRR